jgi:hypothetical protein
VGRSSRAGFRQLTGVSILLGLDQPAAVVERVSLHPSNENHLLSTEMRDVARRMILIGAMRTGPLKATQEAARVIHRRQRSLDSRAGSGGVNQIRAKDVAVLVLCPNRFGSKPDRLLTKEIRAAEVAVAIEPLEKVRSCEPSRLDSAGEPLPTYVALFARTTNASRSACLTMSSCYLMAPTRLVAAWADAGR